jgi:hypothetical protein
MRSAGAKERDLHGNVYREYGKYGEYAGYGEKNT